MTMKAAQDMARKRWEGTSDEERLATGKMLAEARKDAMTPEQRSAIAKKAAAARWGKKKAKKGKKPK
jgi:hypothetical protein